MAHKVLYLTYFLVDIKHIKQHILPDCTSQFQEDFYLLHLIFVSSWLRLKH